MAAGYYLNSKADSLRQDSKSLSLDPKASTPSGGFISSCIPSDNALRWLRVVVYGLAAALITCLFTGWQQYSLILLKGGVYAWRCSEGTLEPNSEIPGLSTCRDQELAIDNLLPLVSAFELAGGFIAGVVTDLIGPQLCGLSGCVVGFLSYLMLVYSTQKVNLYNLSMILTGIAINLTAFPALTLVYYFPTAAASTSAYIVGCQCFSSVVSVVLWEIWKSSPSITFHQLWWGYLLIIWVPLSIVYVLLLPNKNKTSLLMAADEVQEHFSMKTLLHHVISPAYIVMNVLMVILMLQTNYWQLIVRSQLGVTTSEILGYTMPIQAVTALVLGRCADYLHSPIMIAIVHLLYSVIYGLVGAGKSNVQYLSVVLFNFAMPYAFAARYGFVQERFPTRYYGMLAGIGGAICGGGVLMTNILTYLDTPRESSLFLALITILALPLCVWLHMDLIKFLAKKEKLPQGTIAGAEPESAPLREQTSLDNHISVTPPRSQAQSSSFETMSK